MPKKRRTPPAPEYLKPLPEKPDITKPTPQEGFDRFNEVLRQERQNQRDIIAERHKYFEQTGNPLYIWAAYKRARTLPGPIPGWILKYLDEVADMLLVGKNQLSDAALCLGFELKDGGHGPFLQFVKEQIKIFAYDEVVKIIQDPEKSIEFACEKAGEKIREYWGDDYDLQTIKKWYYEFKARNAP